MTTTLKRRVLGVVAVGALASVTFVSAASASPLPPITGVGTGSCHVAGKVSFSPPLALGGTATSETITLQTNLVKCSGGTGDALTIKHATSSANTLTLGSNDCSALATLTSGSLSTNVLWKTTTGSHPLVPSTVTFTSGSVGTSSLGKASLSLGGSVTAGSFNGDTASVNLVTTKTIATIEQNCVHGTLGALPFNSTLSTATLS